MCACFSYSLLRRSLSIHNRNRTMTGVRFLLRVTMRRHDLAAEVFHMKQPQKLPQIVSALVRMLLSIGYGAGLRVSEVVKLKVKHIDSALGIIRVERAMLSPETLDLLREWWRLAPPSTMPAPAGERWLFPGRQGGL